MICRFCNDVFIAKQHKTKFFSLPCAQRACKKELRDLKVADTAHKVREKINETRLNTATLTTKVEKAFIGMKEPSLLKVCGCQFAFTIFRAFS